MATWIDQSGQRWKLHVFWVGLGLCVAAFVPFIRSVRSAGAPNLVALTGFISSGIAAFAWLGYLFDVPGVSRESLGGLCTVRL
jgi:hypothetical protein